MKEYKIEITYSHFGHSIHLIERYNEFMTVNNTKEINCVSGEVYGVIKEKNISRLLDYVGSECFTIYYDNFEINEDNLKQWLVTKVEQ